MAGKKCWLTVKFATCTVLNNFFSSICINELLGKLYQTKMSTIKIDIPTNVDNKEVLKHMLGHLIKRLEACFLNAEYADKSVIFYLFNLYILL